MFCQKHSKFGIHLFRYVYGIYASLLMNWCLWKKYPKAHPFATKGWLHIAEFAVWMPSLACNYQCAAAASAGFSHLQSPKIDEEDENDEEDMNTCTEHPILMSSPHPSPPTSFCWLRQLFPPTHWLWTLWLLSLIISPFLQGLQPLLFMIPSTSQSLPLFLALCLHLDLCPLPMLLMLILLGRLDL